MIIARACSASAGLTAGEYVLVAKHGGEMATVLVEMEAGEQRELALQATVPASLEST